MPPLAGHPSMAYAAVTHPDHGGWWRKMPTSGQGDLIGAATRY